mgnify:CR=1 FL=1
MVWSRAGWIGSQRYPIGWGGDPQSDWEGLAASIRGGLSWGMSGNAVPHAPTSAASTAPQQPDAELYVRWLQAAVFSLAHARCTASASASRGRSVPKPRRSRASGSRSATGSSRISSASIAAGDATGLPVMRAMPLAFPAIRSRATSRRSSCAASRCSSRRSCSAGGEVDIALPPGALVRPQHAQRVAGRQVLRYRAALDQFPVFGREGHALPLGRARAAHRRDRHANPLEQLWVFGEPASSLDGFTQARIEADGGRRLHASKHFAGASTSSVFRRDERVTRASAIAVTSGEPAGIGPELCAMLAMRHARATVRRAPR